MAQGGTFPTIDYTGIGGGYARLGREFNTVYNIYSGPNTTGTYYSSIQPASVSVPHTGEWYWEVCVMNFYVAGNGCMDIARATEHSGSSNTSYRYGFVTKQDREYFYDATYKGQWTGGGTFGSGSILGWYVNDGVVKLYHNNTLVVTWTEEFIEGYDYHPCGLIDQYYNQNNGQTHNFGQDSSFNNLKTSGSSNATDSNGYGDFYYTPPGNALALCSANLLTQTIVDHKEGEDNRADRYVKPLVYTGTGSAGNNITYGFKPDLVFIKDRAGIGGGYYGHAWDTSRGTDKLLYYSGPNAEVTYTDYLDWTSTGIVTDTSWGGINQAGQEYCTIGWRANGGTTSSNTDGTITSTVQKSDGFSIVTYTGNGSGGATVGHGLNKKPTFILAKNRSSSIGWVTYHKYQDNHAGNGHNGYLHLNSSQQYSAYSAIWNGTAPTTSVITLGTASNINTNANNFVLYVWADIPGLQKFGHFAGTGQTAADGVRVYTDFQPSVIWIKRVDGAGAWAWYDTARHPFNDITKHIELDDYFAEQSGSNRIYILGNGFKVHTNNSEFNGDNNKYIYCAWAEQPQRYSLGR